MRINFTVPFLRLTGGAKILFDLANALSRRGHRVTAVVPVRMKPLPLGLTRLEALWRAPSMRARYRWFEREFELSIVPELDERFAPDADVTVASSWQTAERVAAWPQRCGRQVYFIQDVERWGDRARADATYRLPMHRVTTSDWIARELRESLGVEVPSIVPLGLDLGRFCGSARPARPAKIFGMLYSRQPRKGLDLAMPAFERLRARHSQLRLLLMGSMRRPPALPDWAEGHWNVEPGGVPAVYARADAWVCASRAEGWGLPPMEAMAMGCAVVTTRVGGTPYFAVHEETALVCEPGDGSALEAAMERLATDGALAGRLSAAGLERVRRMPWEKTVSEFERVLTQLSPGC